MFVRTKDNPRVSRYTRLSFSLLCICRNSTNIIWTWCQKHYVFGSAGTKYQRLVACFLLGIQGLLSYVKLFFRRRQPRSGRFPHAYIYNPASCNRTNIIPFCVLIIPGLHRAYNWKMSILHIYGTTCTHLPRFQNAVLWLAHFLPIIRRYCLFRAFNTLLPVIARRIALYNFKPVCKVKKTHGFISSVQYNKN